ncbi:MAG: hypothetical protein QOI64_2563, partial [Solirubrobacteraceae bacterium]|nr:hypothetical protein [Solirubrobacteraceae bacterium]
MNVSAPPAAVKAIFDKARDDLGRRVGTLEGAVAAVLDETLNETLRAGAERDAHKLAGSLGMFGLPRGSELARELERARAAAGGPALSVAPRLAGLALALRGELDDAPVGPAAADADADAPAADGRAVLLVSPDSDLTERLSVEALRRDMRPRSAASSAGARRLIGAESPDAAVLDLDFSEGDGGGLELLADLAGNDPPVPVVVLTGSEALVDRVEVARRGGRGFIQRSRPASQVLEAVSDTIERRDRVDAKVLVVDDDPAVSQTVAALLAPVGLAVSTLNDPRAFWERLEAIDPDLLVLDLDMPELDGTDLCRAVRADVRFGQLPVLFLTGRRDVDSVQRIFEAGADDYV